MSNPQRPVFILGEDSLRFSPPRKPGEPLGRPEVWMTRENYELERLLGQDYKAMFEEALSE